jgi:hypothetical protein
VVQCYHTHHKKHHLSSTALKRTHKSQRKEGIETHLREAVHVEEENDDRHVLPLVRLPHVALAVDLAHLLNVGGVPSDEAVGVLEPAARKRYKTRVFRAFHQMRRLAC